MRPTFWIYTIAGIFLMSWAYAAPLGISEEKLYACQENADCVLVGSFDECCTFQAVNKAYGKAVQTATMKRDCTQVECTHTERVPVCKTHRCQLIVPEPKKPAVRTLKFKPSDTHGQILSPGEKPPTTTLEQSQKALQPATTSTFR